MDWLFGTPKKEDKKEKKEKKTIFDRYTSAEGYAEDHREDHGGWEEAIDAWERNKYRKTKKR